MNELILATYGVLFLGLLFFVKGLVKDIKDHMANTDLHQTRNERQAAALLVEARFVAHEALDDRRELDSRDRFDRLHARLDDRLTEILNAINRKSGNRWPNE